MTRLLAAALSLLLACPTCHAAAPPMARKKIVLLAGKKSHGPEGNGIHDYAWSCRLIKTMLEHSNARDAVRVEVHEGGWPRDPSTLDTADAILVVSDGRDGTLFEEAPFLASPERVRLIERQIKRGCGLLTFHFSTFAPEAYREQVLSWTGGYFQWEQKGKRDWYSAIRVMDTAVELGEATHQIHRGIKPFKLREEFYYNLRLAPKGVTPVAVVPALKGRAPDGNVVAWATERADGGRGFGTTCGHFYDNWKNPAFRTMMLNALVWTARAEVPAGGVVSEFFTHEQIKAHLKGESIRVLLFAGNEAHKWHNWERTTPRIVAALRDDPRMRVRVSTDIDELRWVNRRDVDVILLNSYCNWQDPRPLSKAARDAFVEYLKEGGGLILVHFANGAFHHSLPGAAGSDWPEYRKIVRRVWNHRRMKDGNTSGHDAFGTFAVMPTAEKHPITAGLKRFEVTDELYFRQDGDEPITPLIVAESKVTKKVEPLAWAYAYGVGRVFQTLLGHDAKTYDAAEAREMLRRAAAWAARR